MVRTKRGGAAAMAGHNLSLQVTAWEAVLEVGATLSDSTFELEVDGSSLRVIEGTGGMQALGEDDKANIDQTIDEEVLKQERITFQSSQIQGMPGDGGLSVQGDLTLLGATHPFAFDIEIGDGDMLHCRRDAEAVRLGHEAVLRALRRAQGASTRSTVDDRRPACPPASS